MNYAPILGVLHRRPVKQADKKMDECTGTDLGFLLPRNTKDDVSFES
jgi:hypothetical protein